MLPGYQRARWAASGPAHFVHAWGLVTYHWSKELVEFIETRLGEFAMAARRKRASELARRELERPRDGVHWLIPEERALVELLANLIVPSDETSPGAEHLEILGLPATETLDRLVAGSPQRQIIYARGLLALDELAKRNFGSKFVDLSTERQVSLLEFLDRLKQEWSQPTSWINGKITNKLLVFYRKWSGLFQAVDLFPKLVQDVFQAFYTNQVSWIWLDYDGPPMPDGYPGLVNKRSPVQQPKAGI